MRIGFIGAGRMGRPMVDRLVAAGHEVRVLGRTPQVRAALAGAGAIPVAHTADVAADVDAVCVCVFSDEQVREVCLGAGLLDAMPGHAVLVVHTTGSPAMVRAIEASAAAISASRIATAASAGAAATAASPAAASAGGASPGEASPGGASVGAGPSGAADIGVIDCPVSGGPHDIAAGRVTLFAGGKAEHVERVRPVLATYGDPLLHVGPLGAGRAVKLVNNAVFAANIGLLAEAARLGASFGVQEAVLLRALTHGSAASSALAAAAGRESVAAFSDAVREFLGKDIDVVRAAAAELGVGLGPLDPAIRLLPGQR